MPAASVPQNGNSVVVRVPLPQPVSTGKTPQPAAAVVPAKPAATPAASVPQPAAPQPQPTSRSYILPV